MCLCKELEGTIQSRINDKITYLIIGMLRIMKQYQGTWPLHQTPWENVLKSIGLDPLENWK